MLFEKENGSFLRALWEIGIKNGSILCVTADLKTVLFRMATEYGVTGKEQRDTAFHCMVDTFQNAVGEEGTLLFPAFSWDWCKGKGFDVRSTKGEVGTLSNWVLLNRQDFVRTRHPIYSFLVWGKDANVLQAMDNQDAWSHSSPFYYFQKNGAKWLLLNVEADHSLTFAHYLEQETHVPYRHPKYFFGNYTDENGNTEKRMYSMHVRDLEVESHCAVRNDWLVEKNVATRVIWEENEIILVDLQKSYPVIFDDMVNHNGINTISFTKGRLDWNAKQTVPYEVKGME